MSPFLRRLVRLASLPLVVGLAAIGTPPSVARADDPPAGDAPAGDAASGRRWMLKFSRGPLQRILVDDGSGVETTNMYILFTVTNDTTFARPFVPLVTATLDTRRERPYVAGGFPLALERLQKKLDDPALQCVGTKKPGSDGRIQAGETRRLVAIFGPVDPGWATFHIEFHGLVNPMTTLKAYKYSETAVTYTDPVYAEQNAAVIAQLTKEAGGVEPAKPEPEYQEVVEKRVWTVDFARRGDEFRPDDDPIEFVGERWKVLGAPKYVRTIPK